MEKQKTANSQRLTDTAGNAIYAGGNLKKLRQSLALSQGELANELNLSQSYYSSVEKSKKPITRKMLSLIMEKWGDVWERPMEVTVVTTGPIARTGPAGMAPTQIIARLVEFAKANHPQYAGHVAAIANEWMDSAINNLINN